MVKTIANAATTKVGSATTAFGSIGLLSAIEPSPSNLELIIKGVIAVVGLMPSIINLFKRKKDEIKQSKL